MLKGVYKRKDGRYESRVYIGKDKNGKRKYRSFYGKTADEAQLKLKFSQQNYEREFSVTEMTIRELFNEWLYIISSRVKESTLANYRMKAEKHIIPAFGDVQCCFLQTKEIYSFIESMLKSKLSARYVSDIVVLFKSAFKYASREYGIKNVFDSIILPKCKKPEIKLLNEEQQIKLKNNIAQTNTLTSLGIGISFYMGLRIGELCALKWSDINFEKRTLTVTKTIQRVQCKNKKSKTRLITAEPKSTSSIREIPIPECIFPVLEHFKSNSDFYVLSGKSSPLEPRTMQYRFVKFLKNANLPLIHFHTLRHMFATNCVVLGFDVKTLSEILGHSSIEITLNRYVHSDIERKRNCMDLLKTA